MAALNRPTTASYEVHENVRVDTQDNEDHTFCGILFPIKIKEDLPVSQLVLHSVAVRGRLGNMTVWVSNENAPTEPPTTPRTRIHLGQRQDRRENNNNNNGSNFHFRLHHRHWTKVYEQFHAPSMRQYQKMDFSNNPIILKPGTVRALYIHSTLQGDEAIVYDNTRHSFQPFGGGGHWGRQPVARMAREENATPRYQDNFIAIYTGKAHLSTEPFGQTNIWGWDNAWRDFREFVGQLHYGTVFQLWQPTLHGRFGTLFDKSTRSILMLQRRWDCPVSMLPDECIFYILNMCRWDWFNDEGRQLKDKRRQRQARLRALDEQQRRQREQEAEQQQLQQQVQQQQQQQVQQQQQQQQHRDEEDGKPCALRVPSQPSVCGIRPDAMATSTSTCASRRHDENDHHHESFSSSGGGGGGGGGEDSQFFDAQEHQDDDETAARQQMDTSSCGMHNNGLRQEDGSEGSEEDDDDDEDYEASDDDAHMQEEQRDDDDDDDDDSEPNDDDDDDDDDDDGWDRANGYRANPSYLRFRYVSSDEEIEHDGDDDDDDDDEEELENRHAWFRRHFARIHILRALAQAENETDEDRVVLMHLD